MISVTNLTKSFSGEYLFKDISFTVNDKEKVGLVGRNGSGKTTLIKMLAGEEESDDGNVLYPKGYKRGYLKQINLFKENTILDEVLKESDNKEEKSWQVKKILSGLGFNEKDFDRNPNEFSGGYKMRIALTKVLISDPDLLLLDEPTNYLDITSIRWLEEFLRNWSRELILITHDRTFMDKVCSHIIGLHRKSIKKIHGSTQKYFEYLSNHEEDFEKKRINEEKKRKHMEDFISKFRAKARQANLAQSRIKTLEKQAPLEKLEKIETLSFTFNETVSPPKYYLKASNVSFSYSEKLKPIFTDFSFDVLSNDRIGIIGQNGKGKSTLIKVLAGCLSPMSGCVIKQPNVIEAFFNQDDVTLLNDALTVEEEIMNALENGDRKKVRDIAGSMMFSGDNALKKIKVLSGGEKCRVILGKVIAKPANFLLLDEPSHHLDMFSCESLITALKKFNGAFILVTHDERFLHELVNKLIVFRGEKPFIFHGNYREYLEKHGWENDTTQKLNITLIKTKNDSQIDIKKNQKTLRTELIAKRSKYLHPLKKSIQVLENEIMHKEELRSKVNNDLIDASSKGISALIIKLSKELSELNQSIENKYKEFYKLNDEYDKIDKELTL